MEDGTFGVLISQGIEPGRMTLEAFLRFVHEQAIRHKSLAPHDPFPETVCSVFKMPRGGSRRMVRVKICCIASVAEAELAVRHGAAALGLVGRMPSGPGPIEDGLIAEIAAWAPPAVATFLLTSETRPDSIADHVRRCGTNTVQLVDAVAPQAYDALRKAAPQVKIVQVIHVTGPESVDEAKSCAPLVDALLLDSGRPGAAVRELGGTGRVHDWSLSRRIVAEAGGPVFLAGGLNPDNVAEAYDQVRPFGVDLCTGVRRDGRLDEGRLRAFFGALAGQAPAGFHPHRR